MYIHSYLSIYILSVFHVLSCSSIINYNLKIIFYLVSKLSLCIESPAGINCMNPLTLMNRDSRQTVAPASLSPPSSCTLCMNTTSLPNSCRTLFTYIQQAVTTSINPSTLFNNANEISAFINISLACRNSPDPILLSQLRYQSEIICQRSNTENRDTMGNTVVGALDMRALTQCSTCGMIPCTPGMYCGLNTVPEMCPSGYYCPTPAEKYICPKDYFCPLNTVTPIKCRSIAIGSCSEGSNREVVWVPLLICMILFSLIGLIKYRSPYIPYLVRLLGRTGPSLKEDIREIDGDTDSDNDEDTSTDKSANNQNTESTPSSPKLTKPIINSNGLIVNFNHVRLVSGTNVRLTDATGSIHPGRFTAIIGGSGAGKTSLMNVLLGRENATAGTVQYSLHSSPDTYLSSSLLQKIVGFVPQTDVMLRELTVEQVLYHSARSRLPVNITEEGIQERVEAIITKLGLNHLRETIIGGIDGGLSPGDRKRVNIGIELVAEPAALFLDEPTTGLDASSAMNVTKLIREVAEKGLTCVAVIHQPRGEIFRLLDEILILIPGGKVAYHGPAKLALQYFKNLGYTCDIHANKTDFLLDLVSGILHRNGTYDGTVPDFSKVWEDKKEEWNKEIHSQLNSAPSSPTLTPIVLPSSSSPTSTSLPPTSSSSTTIYAQRPGFLRQLWLNFCRGILQRLKGNSLLIDLFVNLFGGIVIGIVASGGPLLILPIPPQYKLSCPPGAETRCNAWIRLMAEPLTFYWTMTLCALTVPAAVRNFGIEKEIFWREAFSGSNITSYFLGKLISDIPYFALTSFFFLAPMVAIAPFRGPVDAMYAICIMMTIFASSLSYALSYFFKDPDAATLVGVILSLLLNLFGGFVPMIGDTAVWSFTRYTARAIVAVELNDGQQVGDLFNKITPKAHRDPDWQKDLLILLLFSVITNILAYILLRRTNKARKHIL